MGFRNDTRLYPSSARKEKKLLLLPWVVGLNSHLKIIFSKKLLKIKIIITSLI